MKNINALLCQKSGDRSCETGQIKTDFLCSANIDNKLFEELYMEFVQPNAAVFRENYRKNCYMLNTVGYDECALDFIPVADKEYVMVDKGNRCFCGTFTARPYEEDDKIEQNIFSVLIADEWDIRKVMPIILEKRWRYVYFVLNQETEKFVSFFKLKEFPATLPPNVKFFATTEEMRQYFMDDHDAYLPRRIVASKQEKYEALFKEIHNARIQSGLPSNNVFLSICIPTYNRGELALKAVKTVLSIEYDAEIELIVSDNASAIEKEAYEEIANTRDSRLHYYKAEKNGGVAYNIMNCLKKAKGHFALFFSDEDALITENLGMALDWLIHRAPRMGGCIFNGFEGNPAYNFSEEKVFDAGVDAVIRAHNTNYITGVCLNMDHIKTLDIFAQIERHKENDYFKLYPHCTVMALLSLRFHVIESPIILWKFGEPSKTHDWDVVNGLLAYGTPERRIRQEQGDIKMMAEYLSGKDLEEFFLDRVYKFFGLLASYYKLKGDQFITVYRWNDIWTTHYQGSLQLLRELKEKFEDITSIIPKMNKVFLFWHICRWEQAWHTPEENLLPSLQAQVVKYYYEKGTPIEDIDFDQIEKDLEGWVQDFLAKRM